MDTTEFPPGHRLRLTELAERLDMSHMPIREALRRLESLGLVEVQAHRGAQVSELSLEDFEDTHRARLLLEPVIIREAAARFTADDVDVARTHLERAQKLAVDGDVLASRQAHFEFHLGVYAASGSRWILNAIKPVWRNSERYRFTGSSGRVGQHRVHDTEHLAILDACRERNPQAASEAIAAHLNAAAQRIRARLRGEAQ